jgi:hypothetical protein
MVKVMKPEHSEGRVAEAIEEQTAKLPSDTFLWAGLGALGASFALNMFGKKETGNVVGQLAPVLLIMGLYNKIVKIHGHD